MHGGVVTKNRQHGDETAATFLFIYLTTRIFRGVQIAGRNVGNIDFIFFIYFIFQLFPFASFFLLEFIVRFAHSAEVGYTS